MSRTDSQRRDRWHTAPDHSDLQYDPCPLLRELAGRSCLRPASGRERTLDKKWPKPRLVLAVELLGQAVSVEVDAADARLLAYGKSCHIARSIHPVDTGHGSLSDKRPPHRWWRRFARVFHWSVRKCLDERTETVETICTATTYRRWARVRR